MDARIEYLMDLAKQLDAAQHGQRGPLIENARKYLGVKDSSALRTTLAVQLAHLPAPGRKFPVVLELEHDFASWQDCMFAARDEGHRHDWENHIPRLSEFGPAKLSIEDPGGVCERDMGKNKKILDMNLVTWDLVSDIARPRLGLVSQAS